MFCKNSVYKKPKQTSYGAVWTVECGVKRSLQMQVNDNNFITVHTLLLKKLWIFCFSNCSHSFENEIVALIAYCICG